jgi:hypothetical protein
MPEAPATYFTTSGIWCYGAIRPSDATGLEICAIPGEFRGQLTKVDAVAMMPFSLGIARADCCCL